LGPIVRQDEKDGSTQCANKNRRRGTALLRIARTPDELEQLYRFRYRIYVEEMGRIQKHADHVAKRIEDPLDAFATNIVAWDTKGYVVGGVRTNFSRNGFLCGYDEFYNMRFAGAQHPHSTSICTRLMIAPEYRRSTLAVRLSIAVYEFGLEHDVTHNFIDCNDHLVSFFEGLGFVKHIPSRLHEEYGLVNCMCVVLHDRVHLSQVASPFVPSLTRWERRCSVAAGV